MEGIVFILVMFLLFVVLFLFIDLAHEYLLNRTRIMNFRKKNTDTEVFEVLPPFPDSFPINHHEAEKINIDSTYSQLEARYDERSSA